MTQDSPRLGIFWKRFQDDDDVLAARLLSDSPSLQSFNSMHLTASSFSQSDASRTPSNDTFSSVRLPIETPPSDFEEAVQKLKQRPSDELRRARKHHRRALKALRDDAYEALPENTRDRLISRFQENLTALNEALKTEEPTPETPSTEDSASSLLQKALTWLW